MTKYLTIPRAKTIVRAICSHKPTHWKNAHHPIGITKYDMPPKARNLLDKFCVANILYLIRYRDELDSIISIIFTISVTTHSCHYTAIMSWLIINVIMYTPRAMPHILPHRMEKAIVCDTMQWFGPSRSNISTLISLSVSSAMLLILKYIYTLVINRTSILLYFCIPPHNMTTI